MNIEYLKINPVSWFISAEFLRPAKHIHNSNPSLNSKVLQIKEREKANCRLMCCALTHIKSSGNWNPIAENCRQTLALETIVLFRVPALKGHLFLPLWNKITLTLFNWLITGGLRLKGYSLVFEEVPLQSLYSVEGQTWNTHRPFSFFR